MSKEQEGGANPLSWVSYAIMLCLSVISAYLNWNCMYNYSMTVRVITTILAFIFAIYYLIFYLIFKVILGRTC